VTRRPGCHYLEEMKCKQSHGCIAVATYAGMVVSGFEAGSTSTRTVLVELSLYTLSPPRYHK